MRYFLLLAPIVLSQLATAQSTHEVQDYEVKFLVKNAGITVDGTLEGLDAEVQFYPREVIKNRIVAELDPTTIRTGIKIRDKHLKRTDYFNVERFPTITLESTGFSEAGKNKLIGKFMLTIKGVKEEIEVPISYSSSGDYLALSGVFTINRLNFDLGEDSITLSDDVEVHLSAHLKRVGS